MGLHVPGSPPGQRRGRSLGAADASRRDLFEGNQVDTVMHLGALRVSLIVAGARALGVSGHAPRGVKAEIEPLLETNGGHAGTEIRAALRIRLPSGFHVQSDKPRDPSLIPMTLTIDPPPGVSVAELVFPPATDLKQLGQSQPL